MSRTLNANEICARALRMVGEFPMSETAPAGEQLREALFWLDMVLATNAGIREVFWLRPATIQITLIAGQQQYSLQTAMGASFPTDGVQFPVQAGLLYPSGTRLPIDIASRQKFEELMRPEDTGVPRIIYIDRLTTDQMLLVWPYLPASETQTYRLELVVQTYSPDLSPAGVAGARPNATTETGVRLAWNEWLVHTLACRLGSGPINKQPENRLSRWQRVADDIKVDLDAYENREHDTEPPLTASYGIEDYELRGTGLNSYDSYSLPLGRYGGFLL